MPSRWIYCTLIIYPGERERYKKCRFIPVLSLVSQLPLLYAAGCLFSLANSAALTPCLPLLARHSDRAGRGIYGTNFALANAAFSAGLLLGPAVGGAVAQLFSFPAAAVLCSAIILALGAGILKTKLEE